MAANSTALAIESISSPRRKVGPTFTPTNEAPVKRPKIEVDKGMKRAVLVGCNYPNTQFKLHGCINDVEAMGDVIVHKFGFDPSNVQVLTDEPGSSSVMPTGANIKAALNAMVKKAKPGDVLFFYFSGHGTGIPIFEPGKPFKQDEAIVPCDLNIITDVDFRRLVNRLPEEASFTILSDSCHSGGLIEKEKEQIGPSAVKKMTPSVPHMAKAKSIHFDIIHKIINSASNIAHEATNIVENVFEIFGKDVSLKFHPHHVKGLLDLDPLEEDEGILLSGCQANETSFDVVSNEIGIGGKVAHGAFTNAVLMVLNANNSGAVINNKHLLMEARKILNVQGFEQNPCLYCSDENANAPFLGGFA